MNKKCWKRGLISSSDNPKSAIQKRPRRPKWLGLSVIAFVLVGGGAVAEAQQPAKIPTIVRLGVFANAPRSEAFRQGLRDHGYSAGKNIVIDDRDAGGKRERLATLIADVARRGVDVIVTAGEDVTRAAKAANTSIPIVMANDNDPVGNGFVASLAKPGGNITGLSNFAPELSGKRLEILREVVAKLSRVAVLGTSTFPTYRQMTNEIDPAAKAFGLKLQYFDILDPKDIEPAFRAANKGQAQALLTLSSGMINSQRAKIVSLAATNRLPGMYYNNQFIDDGGLMYYGVNILDLDRRAATYVDKILKGRKPADLPVEQPMRFEFIVNLQAAKQIALTIPPNVLVRADKVIK